MKSILIVLLLSISVSFYADDKTYPACEQNSYVFEITKDKRFFEIGLSKDGFILADERTIQIDKKNKIIKVWLFHVATQYSKDDKIKSMGKYLDYSQYGFSKALQVFDYKNMRTKLLKLDEHNCDGTLIYSVSTASEWGDIIPASSSEGILDLLRKKYKLQ